MLAPATAGNATAPGIAAFLDQYFNSIDTHDYQAYPQSAAESVNDSQCTARTVSLCLVPNENGYLIDNPPSGYHAQDAACG